MQKIMFNDKYGLTKAVLEGRKTMTRRIAEKVLVEDIDQHLVWTGEFKKPKYEVGEVVAVAQSYNDSGWNPNTLQQTFVKDPTVFPDLDPISPLFGWIDLPLKYHKGWSNKMFVDAGLMPHQLRITNIEVERLKDISFDSALKEGLVWEHNAKKFCVIKKRLSNGMCVREWLGTEYKEAFAALIDKVSGKGTWESNPWVFVYEFELVK